MSPTTKLIEHVYHRWLPTGQVRFENKPVVAEKLHKPPSGQFKTAKLTFNECHGSAV
jgi:hypothetical protein